MGEMSIDCGIVHILNCPDTFAISLASHASTGILDIHLFTSREQLCRE